MWQTFLYGGVSRSMCVRVVSATKSKQVARTHYRRTKHLVHLHKCVGACLLGGSYIIKISKKMAADMDAWGEQSPEMDDLDAQFNALTPEEGIGEVLMIL